MKFSLDPPSGFADSYLDIKFSISFKKSNMAKIKIFNDTIGEQIDILGIDRGYILEENEAIVKNTSSASGHINIFNKDKMNNGLVDFSSIRIRCEVEQKINEETVTETETILFYNESKSLDANIVPFDLVVDNYELDLESNEPLKIEIISTVEREFELCARLDDGSLSCPFEVSAKRGKTTVHLPLEMLFYDLQLKNNKTFSLYYVKIEGTTFSRLANRKYVPVGKRFKVDTSGLELTPQAQGRSGPTNKIMDNNFVISDRYLVLCPAKYSDFSTKSKYTSEKLMDLTMLVHESQHMDSLAKKMKLFAEDSGVKIQQTSQMIHDQKMRQSKVARPKIDITNVQFMRSLSSEYDKISTTQVKPVVTLPPQPVVETFARESRTKASCLPCSRKRKNA